MKIAASWAENVFKPKSQGSTNMGTQRKTPKRTAKRDVVKNDQQRDGTSQI